MSHAVPRSFYETNTAYRDRLESRRTDLQWFAHLFEAVLRHTSANSTILDCGCGTGVATTYLHQHRPNIRGVDFSSLFVTEARKHGDYFEVMDLGDLSFNSDSFDLVFSADVIEHITNLEDALEHMRRVLKPGGYLVIQAPNLSCGLLSMNCPRRFGPILRRCFHLIHDHFTCRLKTVHEYTLETLVGDQDAVNLISPIWLKRRLKTMGIQVQSLTTYAPYFKPGPAMSTAFGIMNVIPLVRMIGGRILLVAQKN